MSQIAASIFKKPLFHSHYAKAWNGDSAYTVIVEEHSVEGEGINRSFIATRTGSDVRVESTFSEKQTEWLVNTYDKKYLKGLAVDVIEHMNAVIDSGDNVLPKHAFYGQMIYGADVDELRFGDDLMVVS